MLEEGNAAMVELARDYKRQQAVIEQYRAQDNSLISISQLSQSQPTTQQQQQPQQQLQQQQQPQQQVQQQPQLQVQQQPQQQVQEVRRGFCKEDGRKFAPLMARIFIKHAVKWFWEGAKEGRRGLVETRREATLFLLRTRLLGLGGGCDGIL